MNRMQSGAKGHNTQFGSIVGSIAFIAALYILWKIRQIVLLAFAAIALSVAINCLVRYLMRFRLKRGVAIALSLILLLGFLIIFSLVIVPPLIHQVQGLIDLLPLMLNRIQGWLNWLQPRLPDTILEQFQRLEGFTNNLPRLATQLFDNFFRMFTSSLNLLINLLLVIAVTLMFLANPRPYRHLLIALFPSFYRRRAAAIIQDCETALVGWTQGILFNMMIIFALSWLGLLALNIPSPLANALLAGLLTFIPNVGPVLSVIPPALLALTIEPWKAGAVVILYVLIQQIESNILTPLVMKQQVSLLPALTLLSQAIFAVFFGFLGLFLALPITIVLQTWIRELLIKDVLSNWNRKKRYQHPLKSAAEPATSLVTITEDSA